MRLLKSFTWILFENALLSSVLVMTYEFKILYYYYTPDYLNVSN